MRVTLKEVHEKLNSARQLVSMLEEAERDLLYPTTEYSDQKTVEIEPWPRLFELTPRHKALLEADQRGQNAER